MGGKLHAMTSHGVVDQPIAVTELNQQTAKVLQRVKAGHMVPITERGVVIAFLTPPPPTVTGDPMLDQWIAEGRILPPMVPGTIHDLLPVPESDIPGRLSDDIIAERNREAGE